VRAHQQISVRESAIPKPAIIIDISDISNFLIWLLNYVI